MSDFIMKNVSEDIVDIFLDESMEKAGMCTCARCRADVRAYVLNVFRPRYVVTSQGDALARTGLLSVQYRADIISAIMKGIVVVKENPRHNEDDLKKAALKQAEHSESTSEQKNILSES